MSSRVQQISFRGSLGADLSARLDLPAGPPRAYALFAHCFTCSKDLYAASRIAAALNSHGIAVFRFDFTGLGHSDGEFANTDFSSNLDDLSLAAGWMATNVSAPQLLIGHSLGGAAVLAAARHLPSVRSVVTIGAPADPGHVRQLFTDKLVDIETEGTAEVSIGGRPFTIAKEFLDDLEANRSNGPMLAEHQALLVLHSPDDKIVGYENAEAIYNGAAQPKSLVALDGADHLLQSHRDSVFAADVIAHWSGRYLVDENPAARAPSPTAPVVVAETGQGKFLNHVVVGSHQFLADEPESIGGFDAGPTPYDLMAAGLGACTSMTLRMYADRKDMALDRVTVEVSHGRVHADDCACDDATPASGGQIDHFERVIRVEGDLSADDRESLLRIADRCPVHRSLEAKSHITTELA
ncbi:MAG: bifunctional alpha/beta hydrolase/OsmC family protein [Acidimicrobiia bacterium]|nr:bifunctional alpha/beta hydrolase/OsmC family protein [Acidimicrobiia bacterium]